MPELNKSYRAVLYVIFLFVLAMNPLEFKPGLVFIAACLTVVLASKQGGFIDSVFMTLFFNFAFFSVNGAGFMQQAVINTFVFIALSALVNAASFGREKQTPQDSGFENVFIKKAVDCLMASRDMISMVNKEIPAEKIFDIASKNICNLTGAEHVALYRAEGGGFYSLETAQGKYALAKTCARISTACGTMVNIHASKLQPVENYIDGYCVIVPLPDKTREDRVAVICGKKEFSGADMYVAEFLSLQALVIMKKHELVEGIKDNYKKIIEALAFAIDIKDHETHGHSLATMRYAVRLSEKMDISEEEKEKIKYAALLHDIGKINISSGILNKPSSLTPEEYELVKKHPGHGVEILGGLNIFDGILPIVQHHHEHYDGNGYPQKLKGEEIPLGARICSIADAYSVMRAGRPYRKAMTKEQALSELKRCAGTQFDSKLVDFFMEILVNEKDPAEEKYENVFMKREMSKN